MKNKRKIAALIAIAFALTRLSAQQINWTCSTEHREWMQNDSLVVAPSNSTAFDLEVLTTSRGQTIDGWGGCFNELGWQALQTLPYGEREKVIRAFFDTNDGLKYNICRIPVGANDYSFSWYSFDETENDFAMKGFNIDRDKSILIPYIKAAMKYQPRLKLWASPWSPPTWMKTNKHYANKPDRYNDLTEAGSVKSGDQFIQKKEYLAAYALYLAKFVTNYRKEGIDLCAIHIQNEPYTYNQWPNCRWTAHAMRDFITNYLGPKFVKDKIPAKIWFGTMNNGDVAVFDSVLSPRETRKYIAGVGFQYEGLEAVPFVARKYPELSRMQTETPCGSGTFDWKSAEATFFTIKSYMDKGINSYMYWNMILDSTGESSWGWRQNAQVCIDKWTKKVTYTPEFYLIKHLSYFVIPGSVRLETKGQYRDVLAFQTPQGKITIISINTSTSSKAINVKVADRSFQVVLPAKSFNTLVI